MRASLRVVFVLLQPLLAAQQGFAGVYVSPAVRWAVLAPRPATDESTPNYYGYGAAVAFGYSVKQVLDLGAFGSYLPGSRKDARIAAGHAELVAYGGEVALRLADSIYLGLRGGAARYQLTAPDPALTTELRGAWTGPMGGLAIGAVTRLGKQTMLQTALELMHTVVEPEDAAKSGGTGKRRLDSFGLSFAFVFSGQQSTTVEDTIFKDFLDTMIFF